MARIRAAAVCAALLLAGACDGAAPVLPAVHAGEPAPATPRVTPAGVARPADGVTHVAGAVPVPTAEQVAKAIEKGVDHLLATQNKDGSWGSTAPTLTVDIYAPGAGAFESYQVATSALVVSALVETGGERAADAVRRGTDYLMAHSRVRRPSIDVLYNVWASAYSLGAYGRILATEKDPARRKAIIAAANDCVDMLVRFEYAEGGWGYYDFNTATRNPGLMATTFTTATVLAALKFAADQGISVPKRITTRGVAVIEMLRNPDGSFAYSWDHRYWPQGPINRIKGSLARTPACYRALLDWGGKVSDAQVAAAFENLRKEGRFLAIARKYPRPHEAPYQNSGYFVFYGYYYASQLFGHLTPEQRKVESGSFLSYLLPLQEDDGSWWDYQLYGYHKPYGTAYVLMALARCRS